MGRLSTTECTYLPTYLVIPPWSCKPPLSLAPQGRCIRAVPMQHMVNKVHTR